MKTIPIFGDGVSGKSVTVTAQRRLNCYYDIREDGDKSKVAIYGTPGLTLFVTASTGPLLGCHLMPKTNLLYVAGEGYLYEINSAGLVTNRGTINLSSNYVAMENNGKQLLILDSVDGWIFNTTDNSLTKITDANFPRTATSCTFNDGYFLVDDPTNPGQFRKSNSYDGFTWSPTDYGIAESNPDPLVAVDCYLGILPLFGSRSIEYWQDVGSSGFPYSVIKSATQDWGLVAKYSRCHVNNTIAFLGSYNQGKPQVCILNSFYVQVISTTDIDAIIETFSTVSDATGLTYMVGGHAMYQLTFPTANRSFLYDFKTNMWSEVQGGVGLNGRHIASFGCAFNNKNYVLDYSTGKIYLVDATAYTDNGTAIKRQLRTRHLLQDFNIEGIDELYLDMETGVGLQSGQGSNPQVMLRVSKDNGRTWGVERWTGFGKVGQYLGPRAIWRRLGSGRDFVLEWTVTDPVKFVVTKGAYTSRMGKG